jgi:competence protein ComEA
MAGDSRWKWVVSSGLTRREQQVLIFLIGAIVVGLGYEQYRGRWRRESLVLHRAPEPTPAPPPGAAEARVQPRDDGAAGPAAAVIAPDGSLDLNAAKAAQLEGVPGIGPVRAAAIVRHRERYGPFQRFEDLGQIAGIGKKTIEAMRPYFRPIDRPTSQPAVLSPPGVANPPFRVVTAGPPAVVDLNSATVEELITLDGIGEVLAKRIVAYRARHGRFATPAEIMNIEGIGRTIYLKNLGRLRVGPPDR